jgi:tetratricopeptide (TPR) repeat protein
MTANALRQDNTVFQEPPEDSQTAAAETRARVVGHVELARHSESAAHTNTQPEEIKADDFLAEMAAQPWSADQVQRDLDRVLAEIRELKTENRWDDIIALFFPIREKLPELVDSGMENRVRMELGFILCRAGRHDDSINCLLPVTQQEPDNGLAHYTLAYTALDALFAARTSRRPFPYKEKKRLLELGHTHFQNACRLCPDSVTFAYRHGVLYKEIDNNTRRAVPLFEQAIANWEQKDADEQKRQHQQYPKYIKAMYHLASCLLQNGVPGRSRELMERVIELDRDRDHMAPLFKHFAMGKILHALGRPEQALEQLDLAAYRASRQQATDFVFELAARCCLMLHQVERAAKYINRVPAGRRRPYVSWTEGDVLMAQRQPRKALKVLAASASRDRRSRHKALIRMARIHLLIGENEQAFTCSRDAAEFCRSSFGNPSHEALFWEAAALYRLNRCKEALKIVEELEQYRFSFPNFKRLAELLRQSVGTAGGTGSGKGFSVVR